jgi:uncharacterized protein YgiB involved in biofilm formation
MKRSEVITLTLMMGAATTAILSSIQDPANPKAFQSSQNCQNLGYTKGRCDAFHDEAQRYHIMNAPSFPSKEECELALDVHECVSPSTGEPVFRPVMDGYLVNNPLGTPRSEEEQEEGGSGGGGGWSSSRTGARVGHAINERYAARPIYRSKHHPSGYRDTGNLVEARAPQFRNTPNIASETISRRGFGATSRSHGGGWS